LRINLKGRESKGIVKPGDEFNYWMEKASTGLKTFLDRDTGDPLVKDVLRRNDLGLTGSHLDCFPDLVVQWQHTPACKHREIVSSRYGSIPWPTPGKNPEGRTGNHRSQGFLIANGESFAPGASLGNIDIVDIAPTILALMGISIMDGMEGKVIHNR
jgi:predicted AlkP superfamily phosphohydrolase/phosphomutase